MFSKNPNGRIFSLFAFYLFFHCQSATAQLTITTPLNRIVFQRDANNSALITISGNFSKNSDKIQARFTPILGGTPTDWQTISTNPHTGIYAGAVSVKGGWYKLSVRCMIGALVLDSAQVGKVGVGEVFAIAGQSNAGAGNVYDNFRNYGLYPATDDRVNTIVCPEIAGVDNSLPDNNFDYASIAFRQLNNGNIGPRGTTPWCWGILGDSLVKRLNVPVMFFNTGWAGTLVRNWSESAVNGITQSDYGGFYSPNTPYGHLKAVLNTYCSYLGIRAVLWIQGESDNYSGRLTRDSPMGTMNAVAYSDRLKKIIDKRRFYSGKKIPWVIARTSLITQGYSCNDPQMPAQRIIDGQNMVINTANYNTFAGPETDNIQNPRSPLGGCVHFTGEGFISLANAWNRALNSAFFNNSSPQLGGFPSLMSAGNCQNNQTTLSLSQPFYSYQWSNGATSASITVGIGTYSCVAKDAMGNSYRIPAIFVKDLSVFCQCSQNISLGSGNWNNTAIWSCGHIPLPSEDVQISLGHTVILNANVTAKSIDLRGELRTGQAATPSATLSITGN